MNAAGYRWHIDAAKVSTPLWKALVNVFEAYRTNSIKGQPNGPFTATPYTWINRATLASEEQIISQLNNLCEKRISWGDFRRFCSEHKVKIDFIGGAWKLRTRRGVLPVADNISKCSLFISI